MRDPKRLDGFYDQMKDIHKKYLSDLRFGQLMNNFFQWVNITKKKDIFFIEEATMMSYFKEYVSCLTMCDMMCGEVDED